MQIISLVNYHLLATPEDNTKYLDNIEKLSLNSTVNLPNIYFITPDSYPRSDTLKGYFNFDNSEFDNELERLNFKVLSKSNSNYNHTGLSLPTTFNMSYFTTKGDIDGDEVIELYNNNLAYEYLKSGGYKLRNNSSYFSTAYNSYADSNANCRGGNEFLTELIPTTPLRSFSLITDTQRAAKRKDILCTIDNIGSSLKYSSPIFEVTHLIAPHPPYVFNENGEDTTEMHLSLTGIDRWYAKEPYVAQLKYVNKRLVESVTKILDSSQNSIIIIQSDHGTLSSASREKEIGDMRPEVLKERSRNYTAIYLPEYCDGSQLYDSITNVNTLRIVFNACFDAGFQILEDRVYFAPAKITNLNFRDITNIVR